MLRIDPVSALAIRPCGVIYQDRGKAGWAFPFLLEMTELEADNLEIRLMLALVYLSDHQVKKARKRLPAEPDLAKTVGRIADGRGEYAYAVQLLKGISQKRTDGGDLFYHLGMA